MNKQYSILVPFIFLLLISCSNFKGGKALEQMNTKPTKSFLDNERLDSLRMNFELFKDAFAGYYQPNTLERFVDVEKYNLPSANESFESYTVVPMERFTILHTNLVKWNTDKPIKSLLQLKSGFADALLLYGKDFIFCVYYKTENNKWRTVGFSPLTKLYSDALSRVYAQKNITFFQVEIVGQREARFLAYECDGVLMSLPHDGICRTLKDELLAFKRKMTNGKGLEE